MTSSADILAAASAGGVPLKKDKIKSLVEALTKVVAVGENEIPGLSVVVIVDGKPITGDMEEVVRDFFHQLVSIPETDVNVLTKDGFVALAVAAFGDNDTTRKAASTVFDKKGA